MSKILFVDDCKEPKMYVDGPVTLVFTGEAAVAAWRNDSALDTIYLDNDMGYGIQGYQALEQMIEIRMPKKVFTITNNYPARKRMWDICKDFGIEFESAETISHKKFWGKCQ